MNISQMMDEIWQTAMPKIDEEFEYDQQQQQQLQEQENQIIHNQQEADHDTFGVPSTTWIPQIVMSQRAEYNASPSPIANTPGRIETPEIHHTPSGRHTPSNIDGQEYLDTFELPLLSPCNPSNFENEISGYMEWEDIPLPITPTPISLANGSLMLHNTQHLDNFAKIPTEQQHHEYQSLSRTEALKAVYNVLQETIESNHNGCVVDSNHANDANHIRCYDIDMNNGKEEEEEKSDLEETLGDIQRKIEKNKRKLNCIELLENKQKNGIILNEDQIRKTHRKQDINEKLDQLQQELEELKELTLSGQKHIETQI